jgi:Tfp pilus assembly protein PilF
MIPDKSRSQSHLYYTKMYLELALQLIESDDLEKLEDTIKEALEESKLAAAWAAAAAINRKGG